MFDNLAIRAGIVGVAVVGGVGWYYADRNLNYIEVPARIDDLKTTCKLELVKHYGVGKRTLSTDYLDCDEAAAMKASDPRMTGAETLRHTEVSVRFVSPADRQVHTGHYSFGGDPAARPNHVALQVGGEVPIMANTSRPGAIEER